MSRIEEWVSYFNLGMKDLFARSYEESIVKFTKSIEFFEKVDRETLNKHLEYVKVYYNRGFAYSSLQDHDEAIVDYSNVLELDTNYIKAYYNRGDAYSNLNILDKADQDYQKAKELEG